MLRLNRHGTQKQIQKNKTFKPSALEGRKTKGETKMSTFDNDLNANGKIEELNSISKNKEIEILKRQGFTEAFLEPLQPMTFVVLEQKKQEAIPLNSKYTIVFRGR